MPPSDQCLTLRGVRVHNLRNLDCDLPLGRLIVVTGVSGAGKSSLAFDTLYAEGRRRYVESFPAYARQFMERLEPPDADVIGPLPPVVGIRQGGDRRGSGNLAAITNLLPALRLLYAQCGEVECPDCHIPVIARSPSTLAAELLAASKPRRLQVGFAWPESRSGETESQKDDSRRLDRLAEAGFTRLIVGNRTVTREEISANEELQTCPPTYVIIDRVRLPGTTPERLIDSLEIAFREGDGRCVILQEQEASAEAATGGGSATPMEVDGRHWWVTNHFDRLVCGGCLREFPNPEPALFNERSSLGGCPRCQGTGGIGTGRCDECAGTGLLSAARAFRVGGRSFPEFLGMTVRAAAEFLEGLTGQWSSADPAVLRGAAPSIARGLGFLAALGLDYLTLNRPVRSLSRGEAHRARLAGLCGLNLVNLLCVLDEPTGGLHARDRLRLCDVLTQLRDAGNTLVVVEHDHQVIGRADHVIDLGPDAGQGGGRIVYQGLPSGLRDCPESVTGKFLDSSSGSGSGPGNSRRQATGWLRLEGATGRNLRNISVEIPLGVLCVVTGVSGSGKSSLIIDTLVPALVAALPRRAPEPRLGLKRTGQAGLSEDPPVSSAIHDSDRASGSTAQTTFSRLEGVEQLEGVVVLDAGSISHSPRSHPASILGVFGEIRQLFAQTEEARVKHLTPRHFSFQAVGGGGCASCAGTGSIAVDMQFLPDAVVPCADCRGTRYRPEILEAKYRGLSIAEVLNLTAQEGLGVFRGQTRIQRRLKRLRDVGLGYIPLGQSVRTLSDGEGQRLKMAALLAKGTRGRTLIVLDEPTVGLHPRDVQGLWECWSQLLAGGHSLIVVEHHLDVIAAADHVIDLGPEAGAEGGTVVATGTPEQICQVAQSHTGEWLRRRFSEFAG
ncbi:MAG: hypothetical protein ACKV0T_01500 [Planctomycetales bacterium]